MDFMETLSYPLKDIKKLVIGGLLVFPGMILLLIPAIIALGYVIKAAGDTVRGKNELPEFDNWGYFLMKGLGYFLINISYVLIACILFVPAIILFIAGGENTALVLAGILLAVVAIVPAFILLIMAYIALVRYGEKENIGEAFAFGEIFRNLKANLGEYIVGFIFIIAVSIGLGILQAILQITIIGIIFLGVIYFYSYLFYMRVFAQIYRETKEKIGGN